jgi:FixJ family two-component response regulator
MTTTRKTIAQRIEAKHGRDVVIVIGSSIEARAMVSSMLAPLPVELVCYSSAEQLLTVAPPPTVGCLLMDARPASSSRVALASQLRERGWYAPILLFSDGATVGEAIEAMHQGAFCFLEQPFAEQDVILWVQRALDVSRRERHLRVRLDTLTARQRAMFLRLVDGSTNGDIARALGIGIATAQVDRARLLEKLRAKSVLDLVHLAYHLRLRVPGQFFLSEQSALKEAPSPPSGLPEPHPDWERLDSLGETP